MTRRRSLPKSARLRRTRDIREMFREGRRRTSGSLEAYTRRTPGSRGPRIGIVVPRHGHSIVDRNRLRRRLRELLRTEWLPTARHREAGVDLLLRARRSAYDQTFCELRAELAECVGAVGHGDRPPESAEC